MTLVVGRISGGSVNVVSDTMLTNELMEHAKSVRLSHSTLTSPRAQRQPLRAPWPRSHASTSSSAA